MKSDQTFPEVSIKATRSSRDEKKKNYTITEKGTFYHIFSFQNSGAYKLIMISQFSHIFRLASCVSNLELSKFKYSKLFLQYSFGYFQFTMNVV